MNEFHAWLAAEDKSQHTRNNYREDIKIFTEWYQSKYSEDPVLALIQPVEIREFRTHLSEARHMEPSTVNRKLAALSSLMRWAELVGKAPEIRMPKAIAETNKPPRWLEKKEERAIIRAVKRLGCTRDDAIVTFLLNTGLRIAEAADLQWRDITVTERAGQVVVRKGKGRKQRTVPLNSEARAAVKQLREIAGTPNPKPESSPWRGQQGPLTVRGMQQALEKVGKLAGIPGLSPHILRHTFGKRMAEAGCRLEVIADLMGHEDLETTRRYVQPGQLDLTEAVESIAGGKDE